jgi:hypothetical protein
VLSPPHSRGIGWFRNLRERLRNVLGALDKPRLFVGNEVSGTTTIWAITAA